MTLAQGAAYGAAASPCEETSLGVLMRLVQLGMAAACGFVSVAARAYPNDVDYSGLAQWENGCDPYGKAPCQPVKSNGVSLPDQRAFDGLAGELGAVLAPRDVGPAATGGQSGFDVSVEATGHHINNQHNYWARALERSAQSNPGPVYPAMGTVAAWVKKGLPYSFQVGAGVTYLLESRTLAPGVLAKWTLNEGFFWLPDVALTAGANKTLCVDLPSAPAMGDERQSGTTRNSCASDLNMLTASVGAVVSKSFALLGMFSLSPYLGWQKVFVHSVSPFINSNEAANDKVGETYRFRDYKLWGDFTGQECGESGVSTSKCFLDAQGVPQILNFLTHRNRLYAGVRGQFSALQATLQGEVTHVAGTGWTVGSPTFSIDNGRVQGITMPDLQVAATARVGLLF